MSSPAPLILRILGEGKIDVDEAVELLAAVGHRAAVRPITIGPRPKTIGPTEFLPVALSTAWSGSIREMI